MVNIINKIEQFFWIEKGALVGVKLVYSLLLKGRCKKGYLSTASPEHQSSTNFFSKDSIIEIAF